MDDNILVFNNIEEQDLGTYVCKIYDNNGNLITSAEFDLRTSDDKTTIPAKKPSAELYVYSDNELIRFGQTLRIDCLSLSGNESPCFFTV